MEKPRLSAQVTILALGRLMNMAAAAGTLVVLARVLPDKASYGAICQLIVLYMVLSQIFAGGLPQSIYYFLPRYQGGERRGFLTQTIILLMLSGAMLGVALFYGAATIGKVLNSPQLPGLLRVFAIYPMLMLPTMVVEGTLLHAHRPLATVIFNALVRIGMFCALVIPALHHASLTAMVAVWMCVAGGLWVIALLLLQTTIRGLPIYWRPAMLREECAFTLPLAVGTLIVVTAAYLDRFIVSHVFGAAAFGVYSNATFEIPTVTMVANATGVVLMAEFSRRTSRGEWKEMQQIWHRATLKSGIILFASLGFLVFWGPETVRLLFSDRFADSAVIFRVYVWMIPVEMMTMQSLYVAIGASRSVILTTTITLAAEVVCILVFGHFFGLLGIALGAVVARYISALFAVNWFVNRLTQTGWRVFMPWKGLSHVLLVALSAGGVSWLLHLFPLRSWPLPAVLGLGLLVFLGGYAAGLQAFQLLGFFVHSRSPMDTRSDAPREEEVKV